MAELVAVARRYPNGLWHGVIATTGRNPRVVVDCTHAHHYQDEAEDCAESLFHADHGSIVADRIEAAGGSLKR
jgi:hypothetical protein